MAPIRRKIWGSGFKPMFLNQTLMAGIAAFIMFLMMEGYLSVSPVRTWALAFPAGSWFAWELVIWATLASVIGVSLAVTMAVAYMGQMDKKDFSRNVWAIVFASFSTLMVIVFTAWIWMALYYPEILGAYPGLEQFTIISRMVVYFNVASGPNPEVVWIFMLILYQVLYLIFKLLFNSKAIL